MASIYQKINLLKGLFTGAVAHTGPFHVSIDITRRCNLRCFGCRFHSSKAHRPSPGDQSVPEIQFEMFKNLCEDLKILNTHTLFLLGEGEPFLNNRIFDIISLTKKMGFHTTVITNGTLLNRETIESILNSKLDTLQVSLWAGSVQNYVQQYPGTDPVNFENVVNGLKLIKIMKRERKSKLPSVTLHHPINRLNFRNINEIVGLAQSTGCNTVSFSPFLSTQGALQSFTLSTEEQEYVCASLKQLKKQIKSLSLRHNIDRTLLRYKLGRGTEWKMPCYIGWFHSRVRVDGTVIPCGPCSTPMGNLKMNSFREIWNSTAYRNFRIFTMAKKGLPHRDWQCDCEFCCYVEDNVRVHRMFRWLIPFIQVGNKGT